MINFWSHGPLKDIVNLNIFCSISVQKLLTDLEISEQSVFGPTLELLTGAIKQIFKVPCTQEHFSKQLLFNIAFQNISTFQDINDKSVWSSGP